MRARAFCVLLIGLACVASLASTENEAALENEATVEALTAQIDAMHNRGNKRDVRQLFNTIAALMKTNPSDGTLQGDNAPPPAPLLRNRRA